MLVACASNTADGKPVPSAPDGVTEPSTAGTTRAVSPIAILGMTDDEAIVFARSASSARSLEVLDPSTGQTSILAAHFAEADRVVITSTVVAFWSNVDAEGRGALGIWTRASGTKVAAASSLASVFAASADGARVAFSSNAGAGRTSDLSVADASFTAPPVAVVTGLVASTDACQPKLELVASRLFVASCDAGASAPTIRAVLPSNETVTVLRAARSVWATNHTGTRLFVVSQSGTASVHTIPGNRATVIDQDVTWGQMDDDTSVVYRTTSGALRLANTSNPQDGRTLVPSGVRDIFSFSPDLGYALASTSAPDASNQNLVRHDLQLNPLLPGKTFIPTPTEPTLLVAMPTGLALGFTPTSDRALYLADVPSVGLPLGTLKVFAVNGAQERVLARGALTPTLLGSRVIFADHPRSEGTRLIAVDVEIVDAETAATSLVMKDVDPGFVVKGSLVAYTAGQGILTAKLP